MKAKDLVNTRISTCNPNQTLDQAADIMWNENCGSVLLVSNDNPKKICGIITDRDICMGAWSKDKRLRDIAISEVMVEEVVFCQLDDTLPKVQELMKNYQLHRILVVDHQYDLCGIISLTDLAGKAVETPSNKVGEFQPSPNIVGNLYAAIALN